MEFLDATKSEELAFWSLMGLLTKPWAKPFFSKSPLYSIEFHLKILGNIIERNFPKLKNIDLKILVSDKLFELYKSNSKVIYDIIFMVL